MFPRNDRMQTNKSEDQEILITGACITGTRHKKDEKPCQDAWASFPIQRGGWVFAIADGLSSAPYADEGAKMAVYSAGEALSSSLTDTPEISDLNMQIWDAMRITRDSIVARAIINKTEPSSYASTLIIGVYDHGKVTIGHIGDGIVVGVQEGKTIILSPPGPAEYANETACLVQDDWEKDLRIAEFTGINACIIATDGCQNALATRSSGEYIPHEPFILPLISFINGRIGSNIDPEPDITALLSSPRMEQLSGDDKTLIVLIGRDPISP